MTGMLEWLYTVRKQEDCGFDPKADMPQRHAFPSINVRMNGCLLTWRWMNATMNGLSALSPIPVVSPMKEFPPIDDNLKKDAWLIGPTIYKWLDIVYCLDFLSWENCTVPLSWNVTMLCGLHWKSAAAMTDSWSSSHDKFVVPWRNASLWKIRIHLIICDGY